jgi:hypothetical protein
LNPRGKTTRIARSVVPCPRRRDFRILPKPYRYRPGAARRFLEDPLEFFTECGFPRLCIGNNFAIMEAT